MRPIFHRNNTVIVLGRSAQQAVIEVEETLFQGYSDVVDADLADYFGTIPHDGLMKSVARRVVDGRVVLHLIKMWLVCTVEDTDDRGRKKLTTEAKDTQRGIPQGAPISPLLANLLHAPVRVVVEATEDVRHPHRELCGRSGDLV